jgi:hypothetical protein
MRLKQMLIHLIKDDLEFVVLIEDGGKPPSARKLTEAEEKFFLEWTGGLLVKVESVQEALDILKSCV